MTNSEPMGTTMTVLKRDARGRVQHGTSEREAILDAFERSGLSGVEFARVAGINYQTFASWRQDRREKLGLVRPGARGRERGQVAVVSSATNSPEATRALRLVEASVDVAMVKAAPLERSTSSASFSALEVSLPGGTQTQVHNAQQAALLAEVLKALA